MKVYLVKFHQWDASGGQNSIFKAFLDKNRAEKLTAKLDAMCQRINKVYHNYDHMRWSEGMKYSEDEYSFKCWQAVHYHWQNKMERYARRAERIMKLYDPGFTHEENVSYYLQELEVEEF